MRLEPASLKDAAAMAVVHRASFAEPWSAAAIGEVLSGPGGFGLIVRDDTSPRAPSAIRAFALARAVAGEAELLTLAVDPPLRRQGAGAALVEAIAAGAAAAGADTLFLEVAADNTAARALYDAAGFMPVGRRSGYYSRDGGSADALVLRRDLNRRPG